MIRNNMNNNKKIDVLNILLLIILIISILTNMVFSYSSEMGWKGYAVYRNGVIKIPGNSEGLNDHAAIMDEKNNTISNPIIHAPGYGAKVRYDTWKNFIADNSFIGIYRPWSAKINKYNAKRFVAKARELRGISYSFLNQIVYCLQSSGTWVDSHDIQKIRCDGVVEYVYEWFGYKVGGSSDNWDVTKNNKVNYWEHSGFKITPRKQNTRLLKKVQNTEPK